MKNLIAWQSLCTRCGMKPRVTDLIDIKALAAEIRR